MLYCWTMKGTRLAGYEIVDKLGEGGMGEVWRAKDDQLGRIVAIKLLPADFSADPDRRARFEQEARALGALNHPNVVSVFGAGQHEGRSYIVSELVEGESLRAVLDRGRLPLRKVIEISVQIAEAMAAAHNAGIVHRDLKPENIMLTPEGRVKVLDFGLAKRTLNASAAADSTATLALSQPGVIMGTVGYMSPEQVRGAAIDSRSDIFSFGAVLYELVTGHRAFAATSAVETMHAILHQDPPELTASDPSISPALNTIVRRCLEKLPAQRFQSAADLAFALRAIAPSSISGTQSVPVPQKEAKSSWLRPAFAGLGALALFAAGYFLRDRTLHREPPTYQRITFRNGMVTNARFVSGGRSVIYSAKWDSGPARMYLAMPGNPDSRDLQFPDESILVAVSPKEEIAFIAPPFAPDGTGTLARGSLQGGQMRPAIENAMIADWAPGGASLAVFRSDNGNWRLEYPIGTPLLTGLEAPLSAIRVSPDGNTVAYAHYYEGTSMALSIVDRSKKKTLLGVLSDQNPNRIDAILTWSPDGREIFYRSFDPREWGTIYAMDLKGHRRLVARLPGHVVLYDIAPDGRMLIRTDSRQVGILGLAPGKTEEIDLSCLDASDLAGISDDGQVIAAQVSGESGGPKGSVYLRKTDGTQPIRLGDGAAWALSPDGKWISAFSSKDALTRRYTLLPAGAGEEREINIPQTKGVNIVFGWRPDNETLLVFGNAKTHGYQNYAWNQKSGALRPIGPEGVGDFVPMPSPDTSRILTKGPDNQWWVYPVDPGGGFPAKGLTAHDIPVGWRADNRSLYSVTHHDDNRYFPISIIDTETGARTPWKEIHPSRPVYQVLRLHITPDGRAYAYNFISKVSDLYVAEGMK
jgi:eukaryotic-like serine/threonine-protein kinase